MKAIHSESILEIKLPGFLCYFMLFYANYLLHLHYVIYIHVLNI